MADTHHELPDLEAAARALVLIGQERYVELGEYMDDLGMTPSSTIVFFCQLCTALIRTDADHRGLDTTPGVAAWGMETTGGTPPLAAQLVTTMLNDDPETFGALSQTIGTFEDLEQVMRDLVGATRAILEEVPHIFE